MARKKPEPLAGISRDPESKLTVLKSRPLTALWQSDLTLAEFKILDTYLSRIDSHKPEQRVVVLEKGEIERCLGVKRIRREELAERIVHLGQGIKVPDEHAKDGFRVIWLFEEAECKPDEYGVWQVRLECSKKAMQYFFNVEKLGYLRYKLRCITSLKSRYTYILFVYLESNRFRETWEVDLDELKEILNCHEGETYKQFKRFNDLILKRCQKELIEKTECRFTYEPIRKGRTVSAIRFTLETLPELDVPDVDPNQLTLFSDDNLDFFGSACAPRANEPCEFTEEQMAQLREVLVTVPDSKLPTNVPTGELKFRRYHYLAERYAALNAASSRADAQGKPIKNRFAYLLAMVKRDAGIE